MRTERKKSALLKFGWREAGINVARWFSAVNALKTKQKTPSNNISLACDVPVCIDYIMNVNFVRAQINNSLEYLSENALFNGTDAEHLNVLQVLLSDFKEHLSWLRSHMYAK